MILGRLRLYDAVVDVVVIALLAVGSAVVLIDTSVCEPEVLKILALDLTPMQILRMIPLMALPPEFDFDHSFENSAKLLNSKRPLELKWKKGDENSHAGIGVSHCEIDFDFGIGVLVGDLHS